MIHFVLDDFRGESRETRALLPAFERRPLHLHPPGAEGPARAREGEAPFLRFVHFVRTAEEDGIHHDEERAPVEDGDDASALADHVRRHAGAAVPVRAEGIRQVTGGLSVRFLRRRGRAREEEGIGDNGSDHERLLSLFSLLYRTCGKCGAFLL